MANYGHVVGPPDTDYGGSVLTADVAIGDTVIYVADTADFDEDAASVDGAVFIGLDTDSDGKLDMSTAVSTLYTTCDDDTNTVTLLAPSTVTASTGDKVYILDPTTKGPVVDSTVWVALDDEDTTGDALPARLPFALLGSLGDPTAVVGAAIEVDEDDDGELYVSNIVGSSADGALNVVRAMQDQITVAATGDQAINLTYRPMLNSEHLYWNGVYQPGSEWARDKFKITVPDPLGVIAVGDILTVEYLYTDPSSNPIECRQIDVLPSAAPVVWGPYVSGPSYMGPHTAAGSTVVGGSTAWHDGSDSTYTYTVNAFADGYSGIDSAYCQLPNLTTLGIDPATVTAVEAHIRVTSATATTLLGCILQNDWDYGAFTTVANFGSGSGDFTGAANTPTDIVLPLDPTYTTGLPDAITCLSAANPILYVSGSAGASDFTVYEAKVVLTVCKPSSEWS